MHMGVHIYQVLHFVLEGQLSGKSFAVNMCVDCLDADCVTVQAALGWWNNAGRVQRPSLHYTLHEKT